MDASTFKFHTAPYDLQRAVFEATKDRAAYGLFWEMGTGKTWIAINTAAWLYQTGKIDAIFVIAPTDIHANWDVPGEGIQRHLLPDLLDASARLVWRSSKARNKSFQAQLSALLSHKRGMRWLFMGFDALLTEPGFDAAQAFLSTYRCLWIMDEAGRINNPQSRRTKRAMKLRDRAPYRRPMTGSPVTEKPFNAYSLVHWINPSYWRQNGLGNYQGFKHHFGLWRRIRVAGGREVEVQKTNKDGRPMYQNLEDLAKMLKPISSRVLLADMVDLPPKVYTRYYYDMSSKQEAHYRRLEKEFMTWYDENSCPDPENPEARLLMTSADLAIVRQMRLQQIALGYLVSDEREFTLIEERPPGLQLLEELLEDLTQPAIIWGRFRMDTELITKMLGARAVRYDGTVNAEGRAKAVAALQGGTAQFFVATQSTAGEGLTLTAAKHAFYYSNTWRLTEREQSEARNHRIGQTGSSVQYGDLIARNTICEDILDSLVHKQEVSAVAMGDRIRLRMANYRSA